jgi:hypothetical protein
VFMVRVVTLFFVDVRRIGSFGVVVDASVER